MRAYEPEWADEADVPRIARAMAEEKKKGNDPLYLDMSPIPEAAARSLYPQQGQVDGQFLPQARVGSKHRHVRQDAVLRAQSDDQNGDPHRARIAAPTFPVCSPRDWHRAAAPIISPAFTSGFASATAGSPAAARWRTWIGLVVPNIKAAEVEAMHEEAVQPVRPAAQAESDRILRDLQAIMFAYDIGILKRADRLETACRKVEGLSRGIPRTCRAACA